MSDKEIISKLEKENEIMKKILIIFIANKNLLKQFDDNTQKVLEELNRHIIL